jgi:hypothetical protein
MKSKAAACVAAAKKEVWVPIQVSTLGPMVIKAVSRQVYWWITRPEPEMLVDTTGLPQ